MEVNITLLFQVIQFICVYFFLYKYLFIPACKILDENEQFERSLYKNLEHEQQVKDALLDDCHIKHSALRTMLIQSIPKEAIESIKEKPIASSVSYCVEKHQLSEQDKQKTTAFLVDYLSQVVKK